MLMKHMHHAQNVPEQGKCAWMSARVSPACAILPSGRLAVMGAQRGPATYFDMDTCLTFTITHSCAAAKISECLASGTASLPDCS